MSDIRDHQFYLVQRLQSRDTVSESKSGFDRLFSMDYMGSSEYEFGAAFRSLKEIREYKDLVVRPYELTLDGLTRTVYFVGDAPGLDAKFKDFDYWARHPKNPFYAKERPEFADAFTGTQRDWSKTDAWWSFGDAVAWALDADVAEKLRQGFTRAEPDPVPKRKFFAKS